MIDMYFHDLSNCIFGSLLKAYLAYRVLPNELKSLVEGMLIHLGIIASGKRILI